MNKETLLVRVQAAKALSEVLAKDRSLGTVLPRFSEGLSTQDQALLQELCFGVCRYAHKLSFLSQQFLSKKLRNKDQDVQALVYLGMYQLLYTRIPDHAAISATVEAIKKLKKPWAKGMINGVLRNFQRQTPEERSAWDANLQYQYSHPEWMIKKLQAAWPDHWQGTLDANNAHPPLTLRINTRKVSREDYLTLLAEQDIDATLTPFSPYGITLSKPQPVERLPLFLDGAVSVQDEAAQLAADLMDLKPGQNVLDACCAPGGKTCHMLEVEPSLASMTAVDQDITRTPRVKENLKRLGLEATIKIEDVANTSAWWNGELFDRILLDAPCSATGVIRRHPDIKLLRRSDDITKLAQLQGDILAAIWPTLKAGGRLVYATCSVFPTENEKVVTRFLKQTDNAEHIEITADWGLAQKVGRQLLPQDGGHDGFYYAVIEKKTPEA